MMPKHHSADERPEQQPSRTGAPSEPTVDVVHGLPDWDLLPPTEYLDRRRPAADR